MNHLLQITQERGIELLLVALQLTMIAACAALVL